MKKLFLFLAAALLSLSLISCAGSIAGEWRYQDSVILIFSRDGTLTLTTPDSDNALLYTFTYEARDGVLTVGGASVLSALLPDFIPLDGASYSADGETLTLTYSGEEYILTRVGRSG